MPSRVQFLDEALATEYPIHTPYSLTSASLSTLLWSMKNVLNGQSEFQVFSIISLHLVLSILMRCLCQCCNTNPDDLILQNNGKLHNLYNLYKKLSSIKVQTNPTAMHKPILEFNGFLPEKWKNKKDYILILSDLRNSIEHFKDDFFGHSNIYYLNRLIPGLDMLLDIEEDEYFRNILKGNFGFNEDISILITECSKLNQKIRNHYKVTDSFKES